MIPTTTNGYSFFHDAHLYAVVSDSEETLKVYAQGTFTIKGLSGLGQFPVEASVRIDLAHAMPAEAQLGQLICYF